MCLRSVCPKGGKENQTRCGGRYSYGDFGHTDHYLDPVSNMSSLILDTFVKHCELKSIFEEICKSKGGHLAAMQAKSQIWDDHKKARVDKDTLLIETTLISTDP